MLLKKIIVFLFIVTFGGSLIFLMFWDLPAPSKQIERELNINRLIILLYIQKNHFGEKQYLC